MSEPRAVVPDKGVRSLLNNTGATIPKGRLVKLDSTAYQLALPTDTTHHLYGVTMASSDDDEWVDIQVAGVALGRANAALATPGVQLMATVTTGRVATYTAAAGVLVGLAGALLNTASAQDDFIEMELNGIGVVQQGT